MAKNNWMPLLKEHPELHLVKEYLKVPPDAYELEQEFPDIDAQVLLRCDEVIQYVGLPFTRGLLYALSRRRNPSSDNAKFAAMVALQRTPQAMTDDVFFQNVPTLADQIGDEQRLKKLVATAKRHGYTPSTYDMYQSGLARFQGDPEAFVSRSQGRGYIRRLCEQRGWACEGAVNVQHRQPERDPLEESVPLAEDLIRSNTAEALKKNPELRRLKRQELREKILHDHGVFPAS